MLVWALNNEMSQDMRFSTIWHVRPAKTQISLRICAVWSVFASCLNILWLAVCRAHRGLPVGFLLLRYSVLFTVESLSLLYLLVTSWFICFRRFRGLSCKPNIYVSWSTSELRVRLARCETGLSPPVKYFTDRSGAVLLLWIFYVFVLSCVCYVFVHVCLYVLCGHLLGKGWPLGSRLWCLTVSLSLSNWYPGSGVVLDCIDSWSLHPYLVLAYWPNIIWSF